MMIDQEALRQDLIKTFQLDGMSKEKQDELLSRMGESLLRRIFLETMDKLGDAGVREYEALLQKEASQEEIEMFFKSKIPGYNILIDDVVKEFKKEMLDATSNL